jgi:4-amino-4-deoxy-L-arabinose transferase-like glycosyltransferase
VRDLGTLAAVAFGMTFAYGWACLLLPAGRRHSLTLAVVTLGLSLGGLTLVMFWIAWLWPGRLSLAPTLLACAILAAAGLWLARGSLRPGPAWGPASWLSGGRSPALIVLAAAILLISAGIVFNAVYWPFVDTDALAIYAPLGKALYQTGALPVGNLYEGYPMMLPLAYAFTHAAAGGIHEYWAKLVPAVMALGAIGAAAALAREIRSARAGLIAAGLVVLTPLFARWASSGYADVPAAFYFALSALAAWRWLESRSWQDALLTGITSGLAIWTKSSAITLLLTLASLILIAGWIERRTRRSGSAIPLRWDHVALLIGGLLATAGPWYARNVTVLGFFLPDTAWTEAAPHDLPALLVMLRDWREFQICGWLFAGGLAYAGVRSITAEPARRWGWITLLAFALPFLAAWWWLASYDVRFLVTAVPLLGVTAACMIDEIAEGLAARLSPGWGKWAVALLTLAMLPLALTKAVDGKRAILRDPLMTDEEKHRVRLGGLYDVALAINRLPPGSRILGVPSLSLYAIDRSRFRELSEARSEDPPWSLASSYDYVVYRIPSGASLGWLLPGPPILQTDDGFYLFSTHTLALPQMDPIGSDRMAAGMRTTNAAP